MPRCLKGIWSAALLAAMLWQARVVPAQVELIPEPPSGLQKAGLTALRTSRISDLSDSLLTGGMTDWYTGADYSLKYIHALGSPYFYNLGSMKGRVCFTGEVYEGQDLLYDLEKDAMVLLVDKGEERSFVELNRTWVQWIDLQSQRDTFHFITGNHPRLQGLETEDGYYELLYGGKEITVLAKHSKKLEFTAEITDHSEYVYARKILHIHQGALLDISREKDLWKLYPGIKGPLKALRKQSRKKYKNLGRAELEELLHLCEIEAMENRAGKL